MSATEAEMFRRALHRSIERLIKLHPVMAGLNLRHLLILSALPIEGTVAQACDLGMDVGTLRSGLKALWKRGLVIFCRPGVVPGVPGTLQARRPPSEGVSVWRLTEKGEALFIAPPSKIISPPTERSPQTQNPAL
jgi:hypothetical protein